MAMAVMTTAKTVRIRIFVGCMPEVYQFAFGFDNLQIAAIFHIPRRGRHGQSRRA
jgi:hypothetical protein